MQLQISYLHPVLPEDARPEQVPSQFLPTDFESEHIPTAGIPISQQCAKSGGQWTPPRGLVGEISQVGEKLTMGL